MKKKRTQSTPCSFLSGLRFKSKIVLNSVRAGGARDFTTQESKEGTAIAVKVAENGFQYFPRLRV